jgi:hypothetical protein
LQHCYLPLTAHAEPNNFSCAFDNGEYFTAIGSGVTALIRWGDDGDFQPAEIIYRDPNLTVLQFANGNSFRAVWNVNSGDAVGQLIIGETGRRDGGKMYCKFVEGEKQ